MKHTGLVQSLFQYYESQRDIGELPQTGFRLTDVHYTLSIDLNGNLVHVSNNMDSGKKSKGQLTTAPYRGKRTAGIKANFLCDNSKYLLGFEWQKSDAPSVQYFPEYLKASRDLHNKFRKSINHPHYDAVCIFLENWVPEEGWSRFTEFRKDFNSRRIAFQILAETGFIHEIANVRTQWASTMPRLDIKKKEAKIGTCSITGKTSLIAPVHPPVIGVFDPGGQAEKALVSFNCDAFTSYGLVQSQNSPTSLDGAWGYTTALNHLLSSRRILIGDMSVIFWAEKSNFVEEIFGFLLSGVPEEVAEDAATRRQVENTLEAISKGSGVLEVLGVDTDVSFYIAGLSPSSSRITVRFWLPSSLGNLLTQLQAHYNCLKIIREFDSDPNFPTVWSLLRAALPYWEGYRASYDDLPPLLAGALMRAILQGTPYPDSLASAVIRRIRADHTVNYCRAAILKAWLTRKPNRQGGISVSLDRKRIDPPYLLGRLFAAYEKTQTDALGDGLNRTISDSFYASASTTPSTVFPRLEKTYRHHLSSLGKKNIGARVNRDKLVQEINDPLTSYPTHLSLEQQGDFVIGYYHQRKELFSGNKTTETTTDNQE